MSAMTGAVEQALNVSAIVSYYRAKARLTLKGLADQTGLSVSYLSDIENRRATPTIETIGKIATALDMTLVQFFGGAELSLSEREIGLLDAFRNRDFASVLEIVTEEIRRSSEQGA